MKKCSKCNCALSLGIFELNQPNNTLNTGVRYYHTKNKENKTNNISNKTSISGKIEEEIDDQRVQQISK